MNEKSPRAWDDAMRCAELSGGTFSRKLVYKNIFPGVSVLTVYMTVINKQFSWGSQSLIDRPFYSKNLIYFINL